MAGDIKKTRRLMAHLAFDTGRASCHFSNQAYCYCVVSKLYQPVGAAGGHTVAGIQGVQ